MLSVPSTRRTRSARGRNATAERRTTRRARLCTALDRLAGPQRAVLALLLVERLTPAEAAQALKVTVRRLNGLYRSALDEMGQALRDQRSRPVVRLPRRAAAGDTRLRKAS